MTRRPLPRLVIVLGVVSLLTDLSSEMIQPQIPSLLLGTLGASALIVGLVDGVADALAAVLKLVAGRLSDGRRRLPFVIGGYALSTAVRPLVSLALSPWHVVGVRAIDRVGKGFRSAPRDALIADVVDADGAPRAYAFHRMMDHAGAIAGPLAASALLALGFSIRETIAFAWIPGALAVVALVVFAREPRQGAVPSSEAEPPAATSATPQVGARPLPVSLVKLLVVFGVFSCGVAADAFVLVRARELGLGEPLLPLVWAVLHVAKVAAAAAVGRTNASSRVVLAGAWLAVAVGLGMLAAAPGAWLVWAGAVVVGAGHGTREPVEKALVRALAPDDARGRAFGAYHLVTGLGALPAGLVVGFAWDRLDGRAALLLSMGVVVVAAALVPVIESRGRKG